MKLSEWLPLCIGFMMLIDFVFSGNQFRGIDEEDSAFLAAVQSDKLEEERLRKLKDAEEIAAFKSYVCYWGLLFYVANRLSFSGVAKRTEATSPTASSSAISPTATSKPAAPKLSASAPKKASVVGKKDQKSLLKGVIVKKKGKEKPKPKDGATPSGSSSMLEDKNTSKQASKATDTASKKRTADEEVLVPERGDGGTTKKPRVDVS